MKKIIVAALAGLSMLSANAGGLVQVLDNEVDDVLIYVDLDSVRLKIKLLVAILVSYTSQPLCVSIS